MSKLLLTVVFSLLASCAAVSKPTAEPAPKGGDSDLACVAPAEELQLEGHRAILAQCQYGFENHAAVCVYASKPNPDVLCGILFQRASCRGEWVPVNVQCQEVEHVDGVEPERPNYEGTL